jgi:uncharacterized membrane protein
VTLSLTLSGGETATFERGGGRYTRPVQSLLTDEQVRIWVDTLVLLVEIAGALVIFAGALVAFVRFVIVAGRDRRAAGFAPVRLDLGRFLALGLEFQLASDVLRTAIAPTFRAIGELAAIAAIRTALNYFLGREIAREGNEVERAQVGVR